jgi:transposase-like protein
MSSKLERVGRALKHLPTGRGRRYSKTQRSRIVSAVQAERDAGRSWASMARACGIPVITLQRWVAEEAAEGDDEMRPVAIVAERVQVAPSVVTRCGLRVEGLDLESIIELVRALS